MLVLGLTFKENCPDIRNNKVLDILAELKEYGMVPDIYDPWVDAANAQHESGLKLIEQLQSGYYAAVVVVVVVVAHHHWVSRGAFGAAGK